jgi:muconate cycloisomerase
MLVDKLVPLTISRGTAGQSDNLFVAVSDGVHEGIGECAPGVLQDPLTSERAEAELRAALASADLRAGPVVVDAHLRESGIDPAAAAAVDIALWDLLAKQAGLPLRRLLGLPAGSVPTSVTVGIGEPQTVRERAAEFLARTGARHLKVKLGNPAGPDADRASFLAATEAARAHGATVRVDANGGWSPATAVAMGAWLAEHGCDYVEQPLPRGDEDALPEVFAARRLPIFLDESVRTSRDVPSLADRCDGVNLKLMKTGGLTEALRLVATARAHGLQTMIGCMGESSVAIAAGVAIGALFDHIDLDSHLNLAPDPAHGLAMRDGVVVAPDVPGHGASLRPAV